MAVTQQHLPPPSISNAARSFGRGLNVATLGPLIALLLAGIFFTTQSDRFLTGPNLSLVAQQVMVVGTLAIGQTLIILTAGIDLSHGAGMALGTIVMTSLAVNAGVNPVLAIVIGLAVCTAFGALNAVHTARPITIEIGRAHV